MRSLYRNISAIRTKDQKGKAPDIKSKSIFINQVYLQTKILNVMSTIRNKVQLIGNVGNAPQVKNLESGKKVASFSIATNEFYKNSKGEKVQNTQWHNIVAWGKTAEIVEQYAGKGKKIAIDGKLSSRSYETSEGKKRYVTEIVANEILLLGNANNANESDS